VKTSPSQVQYLQTGLFQAGGEKRDTRRRRIVSFGLLVPGDSHPGLDCTVRDISDDGARIGFARGVPLPERFWLIDVRARTAHDASVAWRDELEAGLNFHDTFALAQIVDPRLLFLKRLWLKHATR
jgi:hypothetical protein